MCPSIPAARLEKARSLLHGSLVMGAAYLGVPEGESEGGKRMKTRWKMEAMEGPTLDGRYFDTGLIHLWIDNQTVRGSRRRLILGEMVQSVPRDRCESVVRKYAPKDFSRERRMMKDYMFSILFFSFYIKECLFMGK